MACTPRELVGWMHFSNRVKKRRMAENLIVSRMAAHAEPKDIKKALKDWEKD